MTSPRSHDLPTEAGAAGSLARQLGRLVGPAVQAPDDSIAAQEYLALGGSLATARSGLLSAIAEATPQLATDLLAEWEDLLRLPAGDRLTTAERRARIVARLRAQGGSPTRIESATSALAQGVCEVAEYSYLTMPAGSERKTFRFVISVPTAFYGDDTNVAELDELLDLLAPAHTTWNTTASTAFRFDTAGSGFDRAPLS